MRSMILPALLSIAFVGTGSAQTLTLEALMTSAIQHPSLDVARTLTSQIPHIMGRYAQGLTLHARPHVNMYTKRLTMDRSV